LLQYICEFKSTKENPPKYLSKRPKQIGKFISQELKETIERIYKKYNGLLFKKREREREKGKKGRKERR
jgi:hypothetical protein